MNQEQITELANEAANEAIRHIQDKLSIESGDFAGLYFSGDERWNQITNALVDYVRAEISEGHFNVSYDFQDGQIVELFHDRPQDSWDIYSITDDKLRKVLAWNDKDGDFQDLDRVHLLEIFLADFVQSRGKQ